MCDTCNLSDDSDAYNPADREEGFEGEVRKFLFIELENPSLRRRCCG